MKKPREIFKLFLIPVLMGITVLIAAILAKNTTVQKSMSVTETKTVACTSSNYSNRTSDSVCGTGYHNIGNNCTATPTYTYTCPNGGNPSNGICSYTATAKYTCVGNPTSVGQCLCTVTYENPGGLGSSGTRSVSCGSYTSCSAACSSLVGTNGIATSMPSVLNASDVCTSGSANCEGGPSGGTCSTGCYAPANNKCYVFNASSCPSGYNPSSATYSCPSGGDSDGNGNCTYTATQTQTGTTYGGNITCEKVDETYTVKYDKNNTYATGSTADSIHIIDVAKNLTANGYALGGHIFKGWNSNPDGSGANYTDQQSVINLTTSGSTITIYAKWEACPAGQYAEAGAATCSPCTDNTYTSSEGQTACTPCLENQTVNEAHTGCAANSFIVAYDANGGIGSTLSHECVYNGDCNLKENGFTRPGYVFIGWKKENSGNLTQPGTSIVNVISSGTVTYYAQWSPCPAGQYAAAGATSCSSCTGNTYTSTSGQSSCSICETGQTANSTNTGCIDEPLPVVTCQPGTYLTANGTTSEDCEVCPEGYYCPGGDFNPSDEDQGKNLCPANHIDGESGISIEESCKIECKPGTYKNEAQADACVKCPEGETSDIHIVNYGNTSPNGTCYAKEPIENPKTGSIEVGLVTAILGIAFVSYLFIKNKKISNIN